MSLQTIFQALQCRVHNQDNDAGGVTKKIPTSIHYRYILFLVFDNNCDNYIYTYAMCYLKLFVCGLQLPCNFLLVR